MNKPNQIAGESKTLRVGYISPGWPLRDFPNGIVTYVQNILIGLDSSIKPIILAGTLIGDEVEDQLINLYKINTNKSLFQKFLFIHFLITCSRRHNRFIATKQTLSSLPQSGQT